AHAPGVHEGDHGAAVLGCGGGGQLGVGDQVAQRGLGRPVGGAGDVRGDGADDAVGHGGRQLVPLRDDGALSPVRPDVAGDEVVGRGDRVAHDVAGATVQVQPRLVDDATQGRGARDVALLAARVGQGADVGGVGVPGDHEVDLGVQVVVDRPDRVGEAAALVVAA